MRALRLLAALAAAPLAGAAAQGAPVAGRALEAGTRAPLEGVQLKLLRAGRSAVAGRDGAFAFDGPGRYPDTLSAVLIGMAPVRLVLERAPEGPLTVVLTPTRTVLQDVVTTAARREQRAAEAITPVTVVNEAELRATGAASVDQVVQEIPGLQQLSGPPSSNNVMIRGIGDARVLVLLDGEPAPGAQLEDRDLSRLSTVAVQQVEVVKGPLSALYGSQALGGVINVVSRPPDGPLEMEVSGRLGDLGRREAMLSASQGGTVAWRVTGGWRQQDRLPGRVDQADALQRLFDLRGTARYVTPGGVALRVDASAFQERQRWPLGSGNSGFNDNRGVSAWGEAALDRLGGTWRARLFAQDYAHTFRANEGLQPRENAGPPTQREQIARGVLAYTRRDGRHQLDAGVEASYRRVTAPDKVVGERLSDRMLEAYVQEGATVGRFLLNGAARLTWNSNWGTAVTPSLGVVWEPTATLRLRTAAGRGFRGPSFKELGWTFSNVSGGYVIAGNLDLTPESSWQLSAGAAWAPRPWLALEGEVYRNSIRGLIDFATVGFTPEGLLLFTPRNVEDARTQGVELQLRVSRGTFDASLGYEYLEARNRSVGIPLNRRAPHTARLRLTQRVPAVLGLRLDATSRYTARAPLVGPQIDGSLGVLEYQGAFLAWDFHGSARLNRELELTVGIDNAFDARPAGWQGAVQRVAFVGMRARVGG